MQSYTQIDHALNNIDFKSTLTPTTNYIFLTNQKKSKLLENKKLDNIFATTRFTSFKMFTIPSMHFRNFDFQN